MRFGAEVADAEAAAAAARAAAEAEGLTLERSDNAAGFRGPRRCFEQSDTSCASRGILRDRCAATVQ
jgi:hypothetical protein